MQQNKSSLLLNSVQMIIKSLDPNKTDRHNEISIRIIKLCNFAVAKPLSIPFRNCFENECFPKE